MRRFAFVTLAVAGLSGAPLHTYAGELSEDGHQPPSLRGSHNLGLDDVQHIVESLSALSSPSGFGPLLDMLSASFGGIEVDSKLFRDAIEALGQLLSSETGRELLSQMERPQDVFKLIIQVHKANGGGDSLDGLLEFAGTMERVLRSNGHLQQRVSHLIETSANNLAKEKDMMQMFATIMTSDVLRDLKEEVDLETTIESPEKEGGSDDMSR